MLSWGRRVGAAAFVAGLSVLGPQTIAVADAGGDSPGGRAGSAGSGAAAAESAAPARAAHHGARGVVTSSAESRPTVRGEGPAPRPGAAVSIPAGRADGSRSDAPVRPQTAVHPAPAAAVPHSSSAAVQAPVGDGTGTPAAKAAAPAAAVTAAPLTGAQQPPGVPVDGGRPIGPIESVGLHVMVALDRIDTAIYGVLGAAAKWLSGLPATPVTEFLQGTLMLVRRTFFDQPPTLHPTQLTGQVSGPITGTIGAVDPEGEPITYRVVDAPQSGDVVVNADGTYTYNPGPGFDGSDAFVVEAGDQKPKAALLAPGVSSALQGNILEPRRPAGTEALVTVKQGTTPQVTFTFTYADEDARVAWEAHPKALPTLQYAAFNLAKAVNPEYSVNLTYELDVTSSGLASAGSPRLNTTDQGFYMTVVQTKIIKGSIPSNPKNDGTIDFNFSPTYQKVAGGLRLPAKWNYVNNVKSNEYNFENVATHELLHSFGFNDNVKKPGCNAVECTDNGKGTPTTKPKTNWFYYDQFTGNSKGDRAINAATYRWNPAFDTNLIAGEGSANGLYFTGVNAQQAFGQKPVPLLSENPYSNSSVSHLNDYYFTGDDFSAGNGRQLMNAYDEAGVKVPTSLSKIEIGMLKDLGYRM